MNNPEEYVCNNRSLIYHTTECHYGRWILRENKVNVDFRPRGYTPCSHCKPDQTQFSIRGGVLTYE
nr:hypothetical protein [uncultured Methanobrevibacter sp.]